jgi:hypothetical protein
MRISIICFALSLLLSQFSLASQQVHYDSLAVDSMFLNLGVQNPDLVRGLPDTRQAYLHGGSSYLGVQFTAGGAPVTFTKGAEIHVYWVRETGDSCGADVQFVNFNFDAPTQTRLGPTVKMIEGGQQNVARVSVITVPDTGFNALQITVGADTGANSCYLDAIILMQPGDAGVFDAILASRVILRSYPNPFLRSSPATLRINSPISGHGVLAISDALGREVEQIAVGEVAPGDRDVNLSFDHSGIFFARLLVDGEPIGAPLKLTSE